MGESVTASGAVRWSTPTSGTPDAAQPVLGANGKVYFLERDDKAYSVLVGYDEQTGAVALRQNVGLAYNLVAYKDGLVVAGAGPDGVKHIEYYSYDGTLQKDVVVADAPEYVDAAATSGGYDGTVFVALYSSNCDGSRDGGKARLAVAKVTPQGVAWTYLRNTAYAQRCDYISAASTPDGGVIVDLVGIFADDTTEYLSIGPTGALRWARDATTSNGALGYGLLPIAPRVDTAGNVVLPLPVRYRCDAYPQVGCTGFQVSFATQSDGAETRAPIFIADGDIFDADDIGIGPGHVYVVRLGNSQTSSSISSFSAPSLGKDFQLQLQLQSQVAGGGGGSSPPPPPPPPPPVAVAPPPPPGPPLPVVVAPGGGSGVAGAQDPSAYEHGNCDPGANTQWLHVAGKTFTCIVSGAIWDDRDLISAKQACVSKVAIDAAGFTKLLRTRKYLVALSHVKFSIKVLAGRLRKLSYPSKLSGDARAVDDLLTELDAIRSPNDLILTVVSSRRVLDGLIRKLGRGSPQALEIAKDLGLLKVAIVDLVKTVSGIGDVQDCITAFNGP